MLLCTYRKWRAYLRIYICSSRVEKINVPEKEVQKLLLNYLRVLLDTKVYANKENYSKAESDRD